HGRRHSAGRVQADAQRLLDHSCRQRRAGGAVVCPAWQRRRDLHEDGGNLLRVALRDAARQVRDELDAAPRARVGIASWAGSARFTTLRLRPLTDSGETYTPSTRRRALCGSASLALE